MSDEGFDLAQFWMEGGASMYLVLLLAIVAEVASAAAVAVKNPVLSLAALSLCTLPLVAGVVGQTYNRAVVMEAVAMVNPADKDAILAQGLREAARPLQLGGVCTAITLPTAAIAFALSRKKKGPEVASITDPGR